MPLYRKAVYLTKIYMSAHENGDNLTIEKPTIAKHENQGYQSYLSDSLFFFLSIGCYLSPDSGLLERRGFPEISVSFL